jgi:hypothetical protein
LSQIYSTLFWQGAIPTTSTTIYTVPSGQLAVVRDAEWCNASGAAASQHLTSEVTGFGNSVICGVNSLAAGQCETWQGRVVLPSGSAIVAAATEAGWFLVLCGYLFES